MKRIKQIRNEIRFMGCKVPKGISEIQMKFLHELLTAGVEEEVALYIINDQEAVEWYKDPTTTMTDIRGFIVAAREELDYGVANY